MKLYSYVVKKDVGLAPNPFWDYCTLAVCTPNRMGIKAQVNDWIIGTSPVSQDSTLIYAMQISELLSFENYYADSRFEKKKPIFNGSWIEKCGDNMYYRDSEGQWVQHKTIYHTNLEYRKKDLKHPVVFIGEKYYYFGAKAIKLPNEFNSLVWKRQGCSSKHNPEIVKQFIDWLLKSFQLGILGNPKDNKDSFSHSINLDV